METQAHLNHMAAVNVSFNDNSIEHYETDVIYTACICFSTSSKYSNTIQSAEKW